MPIIIDSIDFACQCYSYIIGLLIYMEFDINYIMIDTAVFSLFGFALVIAFIFKMVFFGGRREQDKEKMGEARQNGSKMQNGSGYKSNEKK